MSWFSRLKKAISIKNITHALSKIQPGKVLVSATKAAAAAGVPFAGAALGVETAVGKRVDQFNRVVDAAKKDVDQVAKDLGISKGEAAARVAGQALSGAEAALGAENNRGLIIAVIAVLALLFLLRGK
jgi:hypothetical protein